MAVQVCPYHERLQKDISDLSGFVSELREWKAAEEVRNQNIEEKLDRTLKWMQWAVGISVSIALAELATIISLLNKM
ncbi:MAG: hypothetical protein IMW94_10615 [Thermoanaerobacter sp.]|nr:hypothetical protein [Thermoanaerobacter sp.]